MNYSWSFRTCGLLFKNMPNCHKFEGDVDIYELPSWSTLEWNMKIPWTSYNQIKKMRGKFISFFGLWMKSSKEIKETTWSLTIDDIVHHQQKLNKGLKHQISLLDLSQVTRNYSRFGNLWVWTHHHQETIWCKFEHN